jgi:hypothetical protein
MEESILARIEGARKLTGLCGAWPRFQRAQILYLRLDRSGPTVTIGLRLTEWSERKPDEHVNVTLRWHEVTELSLSGIDPENMIGGLTLQERGDSLEATLEPLRGTHGRLVGRRLQVMDVAVIVA